MIGSELRSRSSASAAARRGRQDGIAALLLAILTLGALATLAAHRSPLSRVWGDEGTYLAMIESVTLDGDLRFDERDLERTRAAEGGRTHLILQRDGDHVTYSKPVLYALVAAPFYALLGAYGPILLNALILATALTLAFVTLRRIWPSGTAALAVVTFTGGAVILPYVAWRMTDLFQTALALAGLALCYAGRRPAEEDREGRLERWLAWRYAPLAGMILLAATVSMRPTNGVLVAAPILAAILQRRLKHAVALTLTAVVAFLLFAEMTQAVTGAANPYRAIRSSFTPATGYPAGEDSAEARARFDVLPSSESTGLSTYADPGRIAYSAFYFVTGRHSGLLAYFPAALVFLLCALRRPDAIGWANLIALAAALAFFIGWRTDNYFGGDTFIGNRYFPSLYPLLLFALPKPPGRRALTAAWLLAALSYGSAVLSVTRFHEIDSGSQSHAHAGIFRLLPYESTAIAIAGRRDRYWAGHFLRFVDPFPRVGKWHAELFAGRPPAELLLAHWRPLDKLRVFLETSAPRATLEVRDYAKTSTFAVGTEAAEAVRGPLGVQVDITTSRPWRRHLYWWDSETPYFTRSLRLRLLVPNGGPATAVLRYFGDPQLHEQAFAYERVADSVPETAFASASSQVAFIVRNASPVTWEHQGVTAVQARYQLFDEAGELVTESERIQLPQPVEPFGRAVLAFEIPWPETAGRYRLVADLVLEHVGWFGARTGGPVIDRWVEVTAE
ncbi:MAG: hypothetical protein AAF560_14270 [Acidobacteriota bacterium]